MTRRLGRPIQGDAAETRERILDEARRHSGYVVMSLAFFVCGLQLVFLTTHLPTYLAQCGMDASYSAVALMLIGGPLALAPLEPFQVGHQGHGGHQPQPQDQQRRQQGGPQPLGMQHDLVDAVGAHAAIQDRPAS